jgi:hypothetical protein
MSNVSGMLDSIFRYELPAPPGSMHNLRTMLSETIGHVTAGTVDSEIHRGQYTQKNIMRLIYNELTKRTQENDYE